MPTPLIFTERRTRLYYEYRFHVLYGCLLGIPLKSSVQYIVSSRTSVPSKLRTYIEFSRRQDALPRPCRTFQLSPMQCHHSHSDRVHPKGICRLNGLHIALPSSYPVSTPKSSLPSTCAH